MKKSKFSDSQIIEALKHVEAGLPVPELCREVAVSTATFYKWRAKFGYLQPFDKLSANGSVGSPGHNTAPCSSLPNCSPS